MNTLQTETVIKMLQRQVISLHDVYKKEIKTNPPEELEHLSGYIDGIKNCLEILTEKELTF